MCREKRSETAPENKYKILIADDEAVICEYISRILTGSGFSVETAIDGKQALAKIKQIKFDALILDVIMPGLSGPQIYSCLQKDAGLSGIPVIFCTALALDELGEMVDGHGWHYLAKPFEREELCSKLRQILGF